MENLSSQTPSLPHTIRRSADRRPRPIGGMVLTFFLGLVVGVVGILLVGVTFSADRSASTAPAPSGNDAVVVHVSATYITQIVQKNIHSCGIPGAANISNTRVSLKPNAPMTINGDEQFGFLGTRVVTINVQPSAQNCRMHMQVLHVDVGGMSITGLVAGTIENTINQQIHLQATDLPQGFIYCATGVRTEAGALVVTYSATPV